MREISLRTMRADERDAYLDLVEAAFDHREIFERYLDADALLGPNDTWLALDGARPVASVQIFDKPIRLRGEVVTIGGIGSVATHPDYERRGIATRLLRLAIDDMGARGHALSLLFTGRTSFYERLDWAHIPRPTWTLTRSGTATAETSRPFQRDDLARIEQIYADYNAASDSSVVRDRRYWNSQLGYAGEPDEQFRVVERDGSIVAYARQILFFGIPRIIEHGSRPGAEPELARLIDRFVPENGALLMQRTGDSALADALRSLPSASAQATEWLDTMWRVLDREKLLSLAGAKPGTSDAELLNALIAPETCVYWPSDRF
jgi:predicted N-acetyltransferase YhbS